MSLVGWGHRAWAAGVLLSALCISAGGCSSGEKSAAPVSADEFITGLCAEYSPCCSEAGLSTNAERCRMYYELFLPLEVYDGAVGGACLAEVRSQKDKCGDLELTPACARVFGASSGTKQPGEECEAASDCAGPKEGLPYCVNDSPGVDAVSRCQVVLTGKQGSSPCVATISGLVWIDEGSFEPSGYSCNLRSGLACDAVSRECRPLANAGQPCLAGNYCVASAHCDRADSTCRPRAATGEACVDGSCVLDDYCDAARRCAPLLPGGATCSQHTQCRSSNCANGRCKAPSNPVAMMICGSD